MKSVVLFLLAAAIASGSPTPVAKVQRTTTETAPFYVLVGAATAQTPNSAPVIGVSAELVVYDADRIAASVAAAVTDVATPLSKRNAGLDVDLDLCIVILGIQIPPGCANSAGHHTTTTTIAPATTSAATCKTKTTAALTTSAPATTPTSVYVSVPSTCTPVDWVNSNTYVATSIVPCATAVEAGTYCGFINPEDPCASQISGSAPSPTADTASAFLANSAYKAMATKAATPSGYESTFVDLTGAVQGNTYLGYKTLPSYDTASCAAYCDATDLCTGFNIFIERDPGWNPDQCSCADPPATYNYKCSIFAGGVYSSAATNVGQYQDDFEVVITASNGYMQSSSTSSGSGSGSGELCLPEGCSQPHSCYGKTHYHPETSLKEAFFPGPFDVDLCISLAVVQSQINVAASVNTTAGFLNAALVLRDGEGWGTWCGLFTEAYGSGDCTWSPGSSGGHSWGCQDSWGIDVDIDVFLGL